MSYCSILPGKYHSNPVIIPIISHFIQSAAAFTLLCLFILLRPSPSTLITVPATDHIQKVSVILCTPHASAQQIVSTYTLLKNGKSLYIIAVARVPVAHHTKPWLELGKGCSHVYKLCV